MTCVDCGSEFIFTSGEQAFHAGRGFTESPKRCAACRTARKAQRAGAVAVVDGRADDRDAGRADGAGYAGGGGYAERRTRQMFAATCAECGRSAQVPFQPTGARPVYCSDCFQARR